jgi:hypothetical protein
MRLMNYVTSPIGYRKNDTNVDKNKCYTIITLSYLGYIMFIIKTYEPTNFEKILDEKSHVSDEMFF